MRYEGNYKCSIFAVAKNCRNSMENKIGCRCKVAKKTSKKLQNFIKIGDTYNLILSLLRR